MTKYTTLELNKQDYGKWNSFVEQSPEGTIFHRADWLNIFGDFFILCCLDKTNDIIAGMPCFVKKKLFFKLTSHPNLTPYQGVIFRKIEGNNFQKISLKKEITKEILGRLKKKGFTYISFNIPPEIIDIQPYIWEGFNSSVRYTYRLRLDKDESILNCFARCRKRDIKRALSQGLNVEFNDDFKTMITLVKKTFQRQKMGVTFETDAWKCFNFLKQKGRCKCLICYDKEDTPLAGVFIIWDEKRSYQLLSGFDYEKKRREAGPFSVWNAIKYTKKQLKLNEYDFEGSMIPGVEEYFRSFGGELTPYYHLEKISLAYKGINAIRKIVLKFAR